MRVLPDGIGPMYLYSPLSLMSCHLIRKDSNSSTYFCRYSIILPPFLPGDSLTFSDIKIRGIVQSYYEI